jgi:hypothetical protein
MTLCRIEIGGPTVGEFNCPAVLDNFPDLMQRRAGARVLSAVARTAVVRHREPPAAAFFCDAFTMPSPR